MGYGRETGKEHDALKRRLDAMGPRTQPATEAFRDGWERIFGKKEDPWTFDSRGMHTANAAFIQRLMESVTKRNKE